MRCNANVHIRTLSCFTGKHGAGGLKPRHVRVVTRAFCPLQPAPWRQERRQPSAPISRTLRESVSGGACN